VASLRLSPLNLVLAMLFLFVPLSDKVENRVVIFLHAVYFSKFKRVDNSLKISPK
jgi:hypothetical protein